MCYNQVSLKLLQTFPMFSTKNMFKKGVSLANSHYNRKKNIEGICPSIQEAEQILQDDRRNNEGVLGKRRQTCHSFPLSAPPV